MTKRCIKICLKHCRIDCLECEKKRALRRKSGDKCSLTTNQSHQHSYAVKNVSCVDSYTIKSLLPSDSVQSTCMESGLKEELDFERRADFGVDDGDGKTVRI